MDLLDIPDCTKYQEFYNTCFLTFMKKFKPYTLYTRVALN